MKKIKNKILESKNYKVGKDFVVNVMKQHAKIKILINKLCKPCKKRAKKAITRKNFNFYDNYECKACEKYVKEAEKIGQEIGKMKDV